MRYQLIDLGDEIFMDSTQKRFGVIDTKHTILEHKGDGRRSMSVIVARYLPLEHAEILCDGLNAKTD